MIIQFYTRVLEENMSRLSDENEKLKKELNELRSSGMSFQRQPSKSEHNF